MVSHIPCKEMIIFLKHFIRFENSYDNWANELQIF